MDTAKISRQIRDYLQAEFPNQGVELTESTDLLEGWFIDSLGIIQTVMFVEETFGIGMSRADINGTNFENLATLAEFVAERLASQR